ncbi:MAPEG family protein [Thalassobaculum sp.]|uniref:MAPEG family protein n=1 Tax=Thalassobaculum sp. TaxID=2022740 RepID=UPI0032ED60A6
MSTDLKMLALTSALTVMLWLPYIVAHIVKYGLIPALTYSADGRELPGWAERARKAHYNAIENLAPFAALVLVAHASGTASAATATAATVYFWARVAHFAAYVSGIPFGRTLTFAVGWAMMLWIFAEIVGFGAEAVAQAFPMLTVLA